MTTTTLKDRLQTAADKLAVLGTPQAVGLEMAARGIRGSRGCAVSCVLVSYFMRELGVPAAHINKFGREWRVTVADLPSRRRERVELAPHVIEFVYEFDCGLWPVLEWAVRAAPAAPEGEELPTPVDPEGKL